MDDDELAASVNGKETSLKNLKNDYDETSNLFPRHNVDGGYITCLINERTLIEKHWARWYHPIYKIILERYFENGPNHNNPEPERWILGVSFQTQLKNIAIHLSRCQPYFRDQSAQRGDEIDSFIYPAGRLHSHPLEWGVYFYALAALSDGMIEFKV